MRKGRGREGTVVLAGITAGLPADSHVIKYYKDVLNIIILGNCLVNPSYALLKTSKFEIIVRCGGSLVGSVPCDRKGRIPL